MRRAADMVASALDAARLEDAVGNAAAAQELLCNAAATIAEWRRRQPDDAEWRRREAEMRTQDTVMAAFDSCGRAN
jgi:hypothetical protein